MTTGGNKSLILIEIWKPVYNTLQLYHPKKSDYLFTNSCQSLGGQCRVNSISILACHLHGRFWFQCPEKAPRQRGCSCHQLEFQWMIPEIRAKGVCTRYWEYLRNSLVQINGIWLYLNILSIHCLPGIQITGYIRKNIVMKTKSVFKDHNP